MATVEQKTSVNCGGCSWNCSCAWSCCRKKKKHEKKVHEAESKWRVYEFLYLGMELAVVLLYVTCTDFKEGMGLFQVD